VLLPFLSLSQTLKGKVLDIETNEPLESVAIYFDNTTIGTTTNDKGEFSISYSDAVQTTLVISYLGYEKVFINNYRNSEHLTILIKEAINALDVVVIDADDGMSRAEKLRRFRAEFLGVSKNGKSCKIWNEKDLRFRYNKSTRTLIAWSNTPVIIINTELQYQINFDIIDFEMVISDWNATSVIYTGTSFYKDLNTKSKKRILKNREKAYAGSVQHFMRALYNKKLEEEGYIAGHKGFKVNPYEVFTIYNTDNLGFKTVTLKHKLDIFYKDDSESVIQTNVSEFKVDKYGNYEPIPNVLFGGAMGGQRVGDALPLDYGLSD
jgi:hypothetical protein